MPRVPKDPNAPVTRRRKKDVPEPVPKVQVRQPDGTWSTADLSAVRAGDVYRSLNEDGVAAGAPARALADAVVEGGEWVVSGEPLPADAPPAPVEPECFHGGTADAPRRAQVRSFDGQWEDVDFPFLVEGNVFRLFESDGTPAADGAEWLAVGDAYHDAETGRMMVDGKPHVEAPSTGEAAAVSDVAVDPVEASIAAARATLADDIVTAIRGLWAAGDHEIDAIMLYRRSVQPEPGLAEAKLATEYIVGDGPAPEGFDAEAYLAGREQPDPEERRAEVVHLFEREPPKARQRQELRVAPKPPPRTGKEIIGRRTIDVAHDLNDEELLRHGATLAHLHMEFAAEEARQAGVKKQMKEKLAGIKAEIARESSVVDSKQEVRSTVVYLEADFTRGVVRDVILEGGVPVRVVGERPILPEERQLPLFPIEDEKAPAAVEADTGGEDPEDGAAFDGGDIDPNDEVDEDDDDGVPPLLSVVEPTEPQFD